MWLFLWAQPVLFLAAILDIVLVLVFWTKMLFSYSQILVTSVCDSFSPVLVDENSNRCKSSFSQFKLKNKTKEQV